MFALGGGKVDRYRCRPLQWLLMRVQHLRGSARYGNAMLELECKSSRKANLEGIKAYIVIVRPTEEQQYT